MVVGAPASATASSGAAHASPLPAAAPIVHTTRSRPPVTPLATPGIAAMTPNTSTATATAMPSHSTVD